jgi:tRNA (cytidine/uridine-2'-O-)-methyltransferase
MPRGGRQYPAISAFGPVAWRPARLDDSGWPRLRFQMMVAIALYQPDIPQNTGAMLRLTACLGVATHVIGPAGFDLSDRALRRAGMDYLDHAAIVRHASWRAFETWRSEAGARLVLMTTRATLPYTDFAFEAGDVILLGRESAGVPDEVHAAADARLIVPMAENLRSLNVATTAAMVLGEALRQTGGFPPARTSAGGL